MSAREDDGQIFINQYTSLIKANSSDVNFDPCKEQSAAGTSSSANLPDSSATDITLQQLDKLIRNQRVNVKATLTMGSLEPKELRKRNGSIGRVKEDCSGRQNRQCNHPYLGWLCYKVDHRTKLWNKESQCKKL